MSDRFINISSLTVSKICIKWMITLSKANAAQSTSNASQYIVHWGPVWLHQRKLVIDKLKSEFKHLPFSTIWHSIDHIVYILYKLKCLQGMSIKYRKCDIQGTIYLWSTWLIFLLKFCQIDCYSIRMLVENNWGFNACSVTYFNHQI
jgi:hypothetical protein